MNYKITDLIHLLQIPQEDLPSKQESRKDGLSWTLATSNSLQTRFRAVQFLKGEFSAQLKSAGFSPLR